MKRLFKSPLFTIGFIILSFFLTVAVFGLFLAPNDPEKTDIYNILASPSAVYPLGTDDLGRCILSRIITGCRTTLGAAIAVESAIFVLGTLIGITAGYFGGKAEAAIVGVIDVFLAFPSLILALVVAGLLGQGLGNLTTAMICVYWVEHARVARSMVRTLKEKQYIIASRALGTSDPKILFRHILPHIMPSMLVYSVLNMPSVIIGISSMSFIGLGVNPPAAEWGSMLNEARAYMNTNPLMMIVLICCIMLSVACFQMIGESMRDVFDPRHSQLGIKRRRRARPNA